MTSSHQRELQDVKLHRDELRRLNALLERDSASLTRQLHQSTDKLLRTNNQLNSTTQKLQGSQTQVKVLKSRLSQRDGDAIRAQYQFEREKREHAKTSECLGQLVEVGEQLIQDRAVLDAEREELDTERQELDDEKEEFEDEKAELEDAQEKLEDAQEELEKEQEELEKEQEELEEDQKELEEEKEEIAAEREEMGEAMEVWKQRSLALERRVDALSALLTPHVAEGVKQAIPVPPAPGADVKAMKRKAAAAFGGAYVNGYKRARW